ncbi:GNAT family N-acetyltransferase [Acidimangrovimonas sediminis]|uniref:GNAT family N-acetyltransferase n=1 Tax=Acidimangrovimonas sediminis TaxID=2056283 RepID=UPI001E547C8B|nr:GNAT family N-acetyltransferase [Acidimangrovimonas sediminis]
MTGGTGISSRGRRFSDAPDTRGPGGPFAGMTTYESTGAGATNAPVIETERLILRGPEPGDFPAFAAFYASPRSAMNAGPLERPAAWRAFATAIGHWALRGYGMWTLVDRASGALAGRAGLWFPEGWPEPELGWTLYDGFEGRGLATEATLAARTYAAQIYGLAPLISIIDPANDRSIALATRLGAVHENDWTAPSGRTARIYRHPAEVPE